MFGSREYAAMSAELIGVCVEQAEEDKVLQVLGDGRSLNSNLS